MELVAFLIHVVIWLFIFFGYNNNIHVQVMINFVICVLKCALVKYA